jgi:hypothetical protein
MSGMEQADGHAIRYRIVIGTSRNVPTAFSARTMEAEA